MQARVYAVVPCKHIARHKPNFVAGLMRNNKIEFDYSIVKNNARRKYYKSISIVVFPFSDSSIAILKKVQGESISIVVFPFSDSSIAILKKVQGEC